jgi:hypothetical protein
MGKKSSKASKKKSVKGSRKLSKNNSKKSYKSRRNDSDNEQNTTDQMMEIINTDPQMMNSAMTNMANLSMSQQMPLNMQQQMPLNMQQQMPLNMQQQMPLNMQQQMPLNMQQQMPLTNMSEQVALNQIPMSQQMMMGNNQANMNEALINSMRPNYGNNLLSVDQYAQTLQNVSQGHMNNGLNMGSTMSDVPTQMTLQQNQLNLFKNIASQTNNRAVLV